MIKPNLSNIDLQIQKVLEDKKNYDLKKLIVSEKTKGIKNI